MIAEVGKAYSFNGQDVFVEAVAPRGRYAGVKVTNFGDGKTVVISVPHWRKSATGPVDPATWRERYGKGTGQ